MRTKRDVTHIVVRSLDLGYGETLCGIIIPSHPMPFAKYPDPKYLERNRPDCQQCLRGHFKLTEWKP